MRKELSIMPLTLSTLVLHFGMLDGSAGVAVADDLFIGASDEENVLHVCSVKGGKPVGDALDLNLIEGDWFHAVKKKAKPGKGDRYKEADIESATKMADKSIYWISSHARDAEGVEDKPERCRLFATKLVDGAVPRLEKVGTPYMQLLKNIRENALFTSLDLNGASQKAPKVQGGFNIECLCAENAGNRLFIGLRNPVRNKKAILLPLTNAPALIDGTATAATFEAPLLLDLGGLGLRDMIWWPEQKCYLIIGGHFGEHLSDDKAPRPQLFTWDGNKDGHTVKLGVELKVGRDWLNPEGLVHFDDGRILILSDDGAFVREGQSRTQKEERDGEKGPEVPLTELFFRSVWLEGTP